MSTPDLTRWNRAGLRRFEYVNANAITILDQLRQGLEAQWGGDTWTLGPDETPQQAYVSTRQEWGWQISRALARASHILLTYLDAYANEGFLDTATQWDNVRRLVAMLGYRPAPPASASTPLVLELKSGLSGTIYRGLAARYAPTTGGPPVVFETLSDLDADASLNALHAEGYGTSDTLLTGLSELELESAPKGLHTGDPIVLEDVSEPSSSIEAHLIIGIDGAKVTLAEPVEGGFVAGQTLIHAVPGDRLRLVGPVQGGSANLPTALQLAPGGPPVTPGEVVVISDQTRTIYRRATGFRGARIVFDAVIGSMNLAGTTISRPIDLPIQGFAPARDAPSGQNLFLWRVAGDWSRLRGVTVAVTTPGTISLYTVTAADYVPPGATVSPKAKGSHQMLVPGYTRLTAQPGEGTPPVPRNAQKILVPPPSPGPWSLDPILRRQSSGTGQPGVKSRGILPGQLVVSPPKSAGPGSLAVLSRAKQLAWARVTGVDQQADGKHAGLRTAPWQERGGGAFFVSDSTVFSGFKASVRPAGWQDNEEPLSGATLLLDSPASNLRPGRMVIVLRSDDVSKSVPTTVTAVSPDGSLVTLADALPAGSTVGNVEVAGNVVVAGHGQRKPSVTLGSGDATQSRQAFPISATDVSWIADSTMPNGVRADVLVTVGQETWTQVGSLDDSGPTDPAYEIQIREDRSLLVVFGDGQNGRRLPTGVSNVTASYRSGVGLAGNLPAGSIKSLVAPQPLVNSINQPLGAGGGADMDATDDMRTNAPATVLTLGRAVSLADFSYLASSQSGVWQAAALPAVESGTGESVTVVVVPAGGGDLTTTLKTSVETFLADRALPGVFVSARGYDPARLSITAVIDVDPARFEPPVVVADVVAALLAAFTLPKRQLGAGVHRSDVFRVIEAVTGVSSAECWIARDHDVPSPSARVQRLPAAPSEVLALDPDGASLLVTSEAPS